jgi:hypothetical protein
MMFSRGKTAADDQRLVDYLLGALPGDETERLDELSITDDEFAGRLSVVENELVDEYVRGELPPATRGLFELVYLSSKERREKVLFAEVFLSRKAGAITAKEESGSLRGWSVANFGRWQWATAALLLLAASGFLLYDNLRLRSELARQTAATPAAPGRGQELQPLPSKQAERQPESPPSPGPQPTLKTAAFVLLAQTRGAGGVGTIRIPGGTDRVMLHLQLESDDFPVYEAIVRDPATNQLVWRARALKSGARPEGRTVSISLPRALLKAQHYTVELTGVSADGASTFAGSYAFRVAE